MTNQIDWKAKWIWTHGETKKPFHVSYFRNHFELCAIPQSCQIHCFADSKYRLWVNGQYVGFGPARGDAHHPYYDTHDISGYMQAGQNVVAFAVQHYTAGSTIFSVIRGGLIFQVQPDFGDVLAFSDETSVAASSEAYGSIPGIHFAEKFDARFESAGWQMPGFDDSKWDAVDILESTDLADVVDLIPRPIPIIPEIRRNPIKLLDVGLSLDEEHPDVETEENVAVSISRSILKPLPIADKTAFLVPQTIWTGEPLRLPGADLPHSVFIVLDFGQETLAFPDIEINGSAGTIIDICYSEVLENNRIAPTRQNKPYNDRIILREGVTAHRLFQPRAFRYLMLRVTGGPVIVQNICAYEAIYPAAKTGSFGSSDTLLNDIYNMCVRTINMCMEDAYTDCPWRERNQWLGDMQPEALFGYYSLDSFDLAKKGVREFAGSSSPEGWMPGVFPLTGPNLPTWGMRFPVIVWEYYLHTGDLETLRMSLDAVNKQMQWLSEQEDQAGLIDVTKQTEFSEEYISQAEAYEWFCTKPWYFVDWTLTDSHASDGAIQGWYLESLRYSALVAQAAGDEANATYYGWKADDLANTLIEYYWSDDRQAFLKYRKALKHRPYNASPDLIGQHENFLFAALGVGDPEMQQKALEAVKGPIGKYLPNFGNYQSNYHAIQDQRGNIASEKTVLLGSPFWSFYALLALVQADKPQAALEYIRLGWGLMLEHGATSCWEMWDANTSMCHGWSAAPAMILPAYILGIRPTAPGYTKFVVQPNLCDLEWAKGTVPTPAGPILVSWSLQDTAGALLNVSVSVPNGTEAAFIIPAGYVPTTHNNTPIFSGDQDLVLQPGNHEIELTRVI